jgi:phage head maturation protease
VKGRIDPASRVRRIVDLDLWEISIVTFPLLSGARVRAVKALPGDDERLFRRHPRLSFTRARAEREWSAVRGGVALARAPQRVARMERSAMRGP